MKKEKETNVWREAEKLLTLTRLPCSLMVGIYDTQLENKGSIPGASFEEIFEKIFQKFLLRSFWFKCFVCPHVVHLTPIAAAKIPARLRATTQRPTEAVATRSSVAWNIILAVAFICKLLRGNTNEVTTFVLLKFLLPEAAAHPSPLTSLHYVIGSDIVSNGNGLKHTLGQLRVSWGLQYRRYGKDG
uniref:Uncharacterized protein n=1 Tax=Glossina austeni TaxID=7395 RepID=A0A1A9VCF1_GLOAU